MKVKFLDGKERDIFSVILEVVYSDLSDGTTIIGYCVFGKFHVSYFSENSDVIKMFDDLQEAIAYHRELKAALDAERQSQRLSFADMLSEEVPFT